VLLEHYVYFHKYPQFLYNYFSGSVTLSYTCTENPANSHRNAFILKHNYVSKIFLNLPRDRRSQQKSRDIRTLTSYI